MAINKTLSIPHIEQQIAKVTAQLEKARAQQFIAAEKAFLTAQKATAAAQARVDTLNQKAGSTPAALTRINNAQAALMALHVKLATADEVYSALVARQEAAKTYAKDVAKVMAGKSLGKKIKFTKKEKAVINDDKKAAKKIAKAEKKAIKSAKKTARKDAKTTAKLALTDLAETPQELPSEVVAAKPVRKAPVKKSPTIKVAAKKAVVKTLLAESPNASEIAIEAQAIPNTIQTLEAKLELSQEVPAQNEPTVETSAIETMHTTEISQANSNIETPNISTEV
jgi:hypothetical protein